MNRLPACRVCLAYDTRLYSILDGRLRDIYEKLLDTPLETEDISPTLICYICFSMMKKFLRFIDKSQKANRLLQHIISSGLEPSTDSLEMLVKQHPGLSWTMGISQVLSTSSVLVEIKEENFKTECVKTEMDIDEIGDRNEDDSDGMLPDAANQNSSSDSEDNLPLRNIKKQDKTEPIKKRSKVKLKKGKKREVIKPDAREIILSKEEQIQEMLGRAKSLNYQNSPYKCDLCYKGFVDTLAYENHKEKHSERSGEFECDICHLRYQTARHLRTHSTTAHSRHYVCNKCSHLAHTANQAREHEKWHSGHTYECQLCSQTFRKPTSYLTHMRKRHPTEHVCNICGDSFVGKHGLLMHKSKAHRMDQVKNEDSSYKYCVECKVRFVSIEAYSRHILSSAKHALANESGSTCLICDLEVPQGTLKSHLKKHETAMKSTKKLKKKIDVLQLPCDQCGSNFVSRSKLQAHVKRVHLGLKYNKNIVCEVCGKKCTSNASLKYHQRTHTGERPFPCSLCPKRFADKNQLRIHSRSHSGEKPYCCAACGKRFTQKPALNRHYRVHTGAKPYDCQFCAKTFSQSNSLKQHIKTVHFKMPSNKKKGTIDEKNDAQNV